MPRREPDGDTGVEVTISRLRSIERELEDLKAFVAGKLPHDHTGTHRKDDRPAIVASGAMKGTRGSPSFVTFGRWGGWALDDGSNASPERVTGDFVDVPASWSTLNVVLWHTTLTGNAGDALMRYHMYAPSAGDGLGTDDSSSDTAVTAVSSAQVLGVTTLHSGITAVAGTTMLGIERIGDNSSDDLTGDFVVLAVVLEKAS